MKTQSIKFVCAALVGLAAIPPACAADDYAKVKYPLVLVHGLGGNEPATGVGYWGGIPQALRDGGAVVHTVQVSSMNSSYVRGEQLLAHVKYVIAATGAQKVNLVGHSHGGQATRYVAAVAPQLVASVATAHTANKGSPVADFVAAATGDAAPLVAKIVDALVSMSAQSSVQPDQPQDSLSALKELTTAGAAKFNKLFPQGVPRSSCGSGDEVVNGVRYYSWSGTRVMTNARDPFDLLLMALNGFMGSAPHDGLIPQCSSHLGKVIKDNYKLNHFDAVDKQVGLSHPFEVTAATILRQHANRLKLAGL